MEELKYCQSCQFTKTEHEEWLLKHPTLAYSTWDKMGPIIYKDRFLNKFVIECQNCGMEIIFNMDTEEEHIKLWNELPRIKNG